MADAFPYRLPVTVRGYELDRQGHLNQAVYLQYAEHARWECLRAAGLPQDKLIADGVGPVTLEVTLRFGRELRLGEEIEVSCTAVWGEGKTFRLEQEYRLLDGTPVATLSSLTGLLDLRERRLVADPAARFRKLATNPALLGL